MESRGSSGCCVAGLTQFRPLRPSARNGTGKDQDTRLKMPVGVLVRGGRLVRTADALAGTMRRDALVRNQCRVNKTRERNNTYNCAGRSLPPLYKYTTPRSKNREGTWPRFRRHGMCRDLKRYLVSIYVVQHVLFLTLDIVWAISCLVRKWA